MHNLNRRSCMAFIAMILMLITTTAQSQAPLDSAQKKRIADSIAKKAADIAQKKLDSIARTRAIGGARYSQGPVEVIEVYNHKYRHRDTLKVDVDNQSDNPRQMASIGDVIVVKVSNIDSLMRRARCKDTNGNDISGSGCRPQEIKLFINGRMMKGIHPEDGAPQLDALTGAGELQFRLDRNQDNDEIWADILGAPPLFTRKSFELAVNVSIGLENDYALPVRNGSETNFTIERIHRIWFWVCFFSSILYLALLIILARHHGLLRDRALDLRTTGIQPPAGTVFSPPTNTPPYSLSRLQMAFWFSIVVMSFLFIWLITDAYDILSASVLGLIGISVGTSLSATVIDNNKRKELINEAIAAQQKIADPTTSAQEKSQLQDKVDGNIAELTTQPSANFFIDILHDVNGVSFHRMQMLVWTLVLGMLFVYTVWRRLSMPDFDPTLLALTGITAGTYLGFKFPEKQT